MGGILENPTAGGVVLGEVAPSPVRDRGSGFGGAREGEISTSALPKLRPLGRRAVIYD